MLGTLSLAWGEAGLGQMDPGCRGWVWWNPRMTGLQQWLRAKQTHVVWALWGDMEWQVEPRFTHTMALWVLAPS